MPALDAKLHREAWHNALQGEKAFYLERPPVFSPAAHAQDQSNRSRMLWNWAPIWIPWEYSDWLAEGASYHETAYIGDWSGLVKIKIEGPDALSFLEFIGTNDLKEFEPGQVKHHVQVNEDGKVAAQGVLYRVSHEEFSYTGGSAYWAYHQLQGGSWNATAEIDSADFFLFSVQGPAARAIMEAVTEKPLDHLRFNQWGSVRIAGADVRILRTGITGEIGYELHGPSAAGNDVWSTVVERGERFGIMQLGARAQLISHVEAGIATNDRDFVSAAVETAGRPQILPAARSRMIGSFRPGRISELFRAPAELGWFKQVSLDSHDFIGRDALLALEQAGGPSRCLVGLVWNAEDVVKVYATLFEDEYVRPMELPRYLGLAVDSVMHADETVGVSTSRVYSPFFRGMISLGHVDRERATEGTSLVVLWGDPDGRQLEIRATVANLPFKRDVRRDVEALQR